MKMNKQKSKRQKLDIFKNRCFSFRRLKKRNHIHILTRRIFLFNSPIRYSKMICISWDKGSISDIEENVRKYILYNVLRFVIELV